MRASLRARLGPPDSTVQSQPRVLDPGSSGAQQRAQEQKKLHIIGLCNQTGLLSGSRTFVCFQGHRQVPGSRVKFKCHALMRELCYRIWIILKPSWLALRPNEPGGSTYIRVKVISKILIPGASLVYEVLGCRGVGTNQEWRPLTSVVNRSNGSRVPT